ncbi:MAG: carboxypeptidase-like regulatory domain-containing protein [Bacteroidia bacterium]|nr:carboxypeptidase-like regulatory domain-containing protein [Bacteroidia bacterium]
MKKILSTFILLLAANCAFAQLQIKGVLLDSATKQPVEFANIGLIGKGLGTVSNEKGEYQLSIPDSLLNEKIKISIIGYNSKVLGTKKLSESPNVFLSQFATTLNEVTIASKKLKLKVLGNETKSSVGAGFGSNFLGCEMAVRLNIKHPKTQIRKFMININKNALGKTPIFRFNVYSVDENGFPKENILKQNIIVEPTTLTGFVEFDLKPYNIITDEDVFISLEWIKELGPANGLYFSAKVPFGATYYRMVSQDKWKKINGVGMGLHAEAGY